MNFQKTIEIRVTVCLESFNLYTSLSAQKSFKSYLCPPIQSYLPYSSLNLILQQNLTICSSLKVTCMVSFHASSLWIFVIIQDCSNIISFRNSSLFLSPLELVLALSLPILQSISHSILSDTLSPYSLLSLSESSLEGSPSKQGLSFIAIAQESNIY